ncbi:MAG: esterase [Epsilonproteobacteria bacterium]|nr:esterase [Campylobacterota bacterium]
MKNVKVILMHGNGGCSPHDYWFPYVKRELEKLDITVIARQFPDAILARDYYWLPFLQDELQADQNTILIGHSSGAVAAMRFAETNKILGTVLVATMHTDLGMETETISGYYSKPWNWQDIKNNQSWIVQFASIDDPYIPIEEARFVQQQLQSDYIEYHDQGHFGMDVNKTEFPEIVEAIKKKLKT